MDWSNSIDPCFDNTKKWTISLFLLLLCLSVQVTFSKDCQTDILFIIDSSSSVQRDFENTKSVIQGLSALLNIGSDPGGQEVALIEYSGKYRNWIEIPFGYIRSNAEFNTTIQDLTHLQGITLTGKALKLAYYLLTGKSNGSQGQRPASKAIVIVITDGYAQDRIDDSSVEIMNLPNTHIYSIALTEKYRISELELIAGSADRAFYGPDSANDLYNELDPVIRCERQPSLDRSGPTNYLRNRPNNNNGRIPNGRNGPNSNGRIPRGPNRSNNNGRIPGGPNRSNNNGRIPGGPNNDGRSPDDSSFPNNLAPFDPERRGPQENRGTPNNPDSDDYYPGEDSSPGRDDSSDYYSSSPNNNGDSSFEEPDSKENGERIRIRTDLSLINPNEGDDDSDPSRPFPRQTRPFPRPDGSVPDISSESDDSNDGNNDDDDDFREALPKKPIFGGFIDPRPNRSPENPLGSTVDENEDGNSWDDNPDDDPNSSEEEKTGSYGNYNDSPEVDPRRPFRNQQFERKPSSSLSSSDEDSEEENDRLRNKGRPNRSGRNNGRPNGRRRNNGNYWLENSPTPGASDDKSSSDSSAENSQDEEEENKNSRRLNNGRPNERDRNNGRPNGRWRNNGRPTVRGRNNGNYWPENSPNIPGTSNDRSSSDSSAENSQDEENEKSRRRNNPSNRPGENDKRSEDSRSTPDDGKSSADSQESGDSAEDDKDRMRFNPNRPLPIPPPTNGPPFNRNNDDGNDNSDVDSDESNIPSSIPSPRNRPGGLNPDDRTTYEENPDDENNRRKSGNRTGNPDDENPDDNGFGNMRPPRRPRNDLDQNPPRKRKGFSSNPDSQVKFVDDNDDNPLINDNNNDRLSLLTSTTPGPNDFFDDNKTDDDDPQNTDLSLTRNYGFRRIEQTNGGGTGGGSSGKTNGNNNDNNNRTAEIITTLFGPDGKARNITKFSTEGLAPTDLDTIKGIIDRQINQTDIDELCSRRDYRVKCDNEKRAQFTYRWYYNEAARACHMFPWGYCKFEPQGNTLRTKKACQIVCINREYDDGGEQEGEQDTTSPNVDGLIMPLSPIGA